MFVYRNISKVEQRFRAGEPGKKQVYTVKPGKEVSVPVKISAQMMELVKEKEIRKGQFKK